MAFSDTLRPGDKVGGTYEITGELSRGAGGDTFLAKHTTSGADVVLKLYPGGNESEIAKLMAREREILRSMSHPNIPKVYALGQHEGQDYLVLEYVKGEPLEECMNSGLRTAQAVQYGAAILSALDCAHKQGIVHRDISPLSIIVAEGRVKLIRFGSAKVFKNEPPSADKSMNFDGKLTDSFYVAPEVLMDRDFSPRSDVYSLAMVLFEAIAGRLPFEGDTPMEVNLAKVACEPLRLKTLKPVGDELSDVMHEMLQKEPLLRPTAAKAEEAFTRYKFKKRL
ncbi:serine/threonine protein kinase [Candidatus Woesearchaeota archaeon]|nr:serine/threonine protein kinase [Candidatus Woesearchaeota archaeon]